VTIYPFEGAALSIGVREMTFVSLLERGGGGGHTYRTECFSYFIYTVRLSGIMSLEKDVKRLFLSLLVSKLSFVVIVPANS